MNPNDLSAFKELFLKSAKKHLEDIDYNLNSLKINLETEEIVNDLYLHMHSLKGECNVMGFNEIGQICEDALEILKSELEKPTFTKGLDLQLKDQIETIKTKIGAIENGKVVPLS